MSKEWPTERVAEQYRLDVRQAFEKENAVHRAEEAADLEKVKREHPEDYARHMRDPSYARAMTVRDSMFWEIYQGSTIEIVSNSVRIILPRGFVIFPDLVEMFEDTSVGWSRVGVGAEIVDGEARIVLSLCLIDYWDDDRAAQWWAKKAEAPTTAEELLRKIKAARVELASDRERPKSPIDTLYAIEYWISEFFRETA